MLNNGTENNAEITFSEKSLNPRAVLSETETGELLLKIEGVTEEGVPVEHPVFFMGTSSWILSENVFYPIALSGFRNTQYYDSFGCMNIKLEHVPKFLSVDLPLLLKRMPVIFDETSAPFPVAITEPPQVVIKLSERRQLGSSSSTVISSSSAANSKERSVSESTSLEVTLGFRYGDLVMQSRDETSAVESEKFTRTISESGQSVW